jgi:hypothetical protein
MKKHHWWIRFLFILILLVFVKTPPNTFAARGDVSIEGLAGVGLWPEGQTKTDLGSTLGFGLGFGYEIIDNLQLRTDVGYYHWNKEVTGFFRSCFFGPGCTTTFDEHLTNRAAFLGMRYLLRLSPRITPFIDFGIGVNFLEVEQEDDLLIAGLDVFGIPPAPIHLSNGERSIRLGAIPGVGVLLSLNRRIDAGILLRYYWIQKGVGDFSEVNPSFMNIAFLISYHY